VVSILSSVYWTLAAEKDYAYNGFTLTQGVFQQQLQLEYATGNVVVVLVVVVSVVVVVVVAVVVVVEVFYCL